MFTVLILCFPTAGKRYQNAHVVTFPNFSCQGSQTGRVRRSLSVNALFGGKKDNNDKNDDGSKVCYFLFGPVHIRVLSFLQTRLLSSF